MKATFRSLAATCAVAVFCFAAFAGPAEADVQLDVPVLYSGFEKEAGMCYLGAFAMTVGSLDRSVTWPMVVAYSGVGVSAEYMTENGGFLGTGLGFASMIIAADTLGTGFSLGLGEGGMDSEPYFPPEMRFANAAREFTRFGSAGEALEFLKQILDSGRAVTVHIDVKPVHGDFSAISSFWKTVMPNDHIDHFMTVTGYDDENIYLNDPTDPTSAAGKLRASVDHFMQAWKDTEKLRFAPLGPWWMIYPAQKPEPAPFSEVLAMITERGGGAPEAMRSFARKPSSGEEAVFLLREVAANRLAFASFLNEKGYTEAAGLYEKSGENLAGAAGRGKITGPVLEKSADIEEKAIALLRP